MVSYQEAERAILARRAAKTPPPRRLEDYRVGSKIVYRLYSGKLRTITVDRRYKNVKSKGPGFDGHEFREAKASSWGTDEQIVKILRY